MGEHVYEGKLTNCGERITACFVAEPPFFLAEGHEKKRKKIEDGVAVVELIPI